MCWARSSSPAIWSRAHRAQAQVDPLAEEVLHLVAQRRARRRVHRQVAPRRGLDDPAVDEDVPGVAEATLGREQGRDPLLPLDVRRRLVALGRGEALGELADEPGRLLEQELLVDAARGGRPRRGRACDHQAGELALELQHLARNVGHGRISIRPAQ